MCTLTSRSVLCRVVKFNSDWILIAHCWSSKHHHKSSNAHSHTLTHTNDKAFGSNLGFDKHSWTCGLEEPRIKRLIFWLVALPLELQSPIQFSERNRIKLKPATVLYTSSKDQIRPCKIYSARSFEALQNLVTCNFNLAS